MSKNFIHVKQRKAGDLNHRFEPPAEFYFKAFFRAFLASFPIGF